MSQIVLGGKTAGSNINAGTELDPMFTELYSLYNLVASISGSQVNWSAGHRFGGAFTANSATTAIYAGLGGGFPGLVWSYVGAGSDQKVWDCYADTGNLNFRCLNDTVASANNWLTVSRTGYVPSVAAFNCSVLPSSDNTKNLGGVSNRWAVVYAATGTINTSDGNEKQDIQALTAAEHAVAVACKGLVRRFRYKDAVAEKGSAARLHFGVIAQDVQAAFAAQGLDATQYGIYCSDTWTDDTGTHTRLGIRYEELLAFVLAAL